MWLFDTAEFMPRMACGPGWSDELIAVHVLSNLAIFAAYMAIPVLLIHGYRKSGQNVESIGVVPRWVLAAFALFIFACGAGHLIEALTFWWPVYRFYGFVNAITALASWGTFAGSVVAARRAYVAWQQVTKDRDEAIAKADNLERTLQAYIEEQRKR